MQRLFKCKNFLFFRLNQVLNLLSPTTNSYFNVMYKVHHSEHLKIKSLVIRTIQMLITIIIIILIKNKNFNLLKLICYDLGLITEQTAFNPFGGRNIFDCWTFNQLIQLITKITRAIQRGFLDGFISLQHFDMFKKVYLALHKSSHKRRSMKKSSLKISQNSQENKCVRVSFLIKFQV